MNENYAKAYFHLRAEIEQPFAVITAFNPYGKTLPLTDNLDRHQELLVHLNKTHLSYRILDVGAQDLSHIETSIACHCDKQHAIAIAKSFEQNDIFWIEDNQVYIINCASEKLYHLKPLSEMYFQ